MKDYTLTESLIVLGFLFAVFYFFRYYPAFISLFKKKKKPGVIKKINLDEMEERIS